MAFFQLLDSCVPTARQLLQESKPWMSLSPQRKYTDEDSLLRQFILAEDSSSAERLLERLLTAHAQPVIRGVVRCKVSNSGQSSANENQEYDDICSEAMFQLLRRLKAVRESGDLECIGNFRSYAVQTAINAFNGYLRSKYPKRFQLKSQLRYLLDRKATFFTKKLDSGDIACGLREWDQNQRCLSVGGVSLDLKQVLTTASKEQMRNDLESFLKKVISSYGKVLLLDQLVNSLVEFANIHEVSFISEDHAKFGDFLHSSSLSSDRHHDQRLYLTRLWKEICELPVKQRAALLLNLRDPRGADALMLFVVTDVVGLTAIAQILEMPWQTFARIWNRLPLDDNTLAEKLGVTRQQVINLRKSARERLMRRLAAKSLRDVKRNGL